MADVRNILIVEDDAAFADFVRAAVESLGHRALVASTGAAALASFRQARPDLVFLDLLLPQRDGFKVCEDIRREPGGDTVPVVMMTGIYKKPAYEKEAIERLKASEYLIKPFGVREVWSAIERQLGPSVLKGGHRIAAPATAGWSLQDAPLACQLAEHLQRKSDGVLFVRGNDATFVLYLRDGAPAFVRSSDPADRLDRILVRTTRVGEAAIAECVRESRESRGRKRLGDVLVEKGLLTRDEVEIALQLQLRLILNRAFQQENGHCLFVPGEHPTEEDVQIQASPRALLVRGARSTSPAVARARMPEGTATLVRTQGWEALVPDLSLKEDEVRLLQLCDGATTVERFLAVAAVAGYDGPRILLALQCAGLVMDVPARQAVPAPRADASDLELDAWRRRPAGALVAELHRRRASGRLAVVTAAGHEKLLSFRAGEVVAVESDAPDDRLAAMLARMQVVDAPALEDVVKSLGRGHSDPLLVRTLVDRELLSATEAYWAAVYQAHGAVHDILAEVPQRLAWTPGPLPERIVPLPDVPTLELAINGVRALDDVTVRDLLPPSGSRIVACKDRSLTSVPLTDDEREVLGSLTEPRPLGRFCAYAEKPAAQARAVLSLISLGLVTWTLASAEQAPLAAPEIDLADEIGLEIDAAAPPPAVALPAPEPELATEKDAPADPLERLRALRGTLLALRAGFEGAERRVSVDRAAMAELIDELLEISEAAKGRPAPRPRETVETG